MKLWRRGGGGALVRTSRVTADFRLLRFVLARRQRRRSLCSVSDSIDAITTPDGRRLAYLEVGDPNGPLVLHNHGGPSSRLEARLFANSAAKNQLRLLCVDRPGMGQSSPQKSRNYSGWADDLVTIADALGYERFGVTGWSEGGPWALAAP